MKNKYNHVIFWPVMNDMIGDEWSIMDWFTKVFCGSFYWTLKENLQNNSDAYICCDQCIGRIKSSDEDNRFVASIHACVDQTFKSMDDDIELFIYIGIVDTISNDKIIFTPPGFSIGKPIINYKNPDDKVISYIGSVFADTGKCILKLINAA